MTILNQNHQKFTVEYQIINLNPKQTWMKDAEVSIGRKNRCTSDSPTRRDENISRNGLKRRELLKFLL